MLSHPKKWFEEITTPIFDEFASNQDIAYKAVSAYREVYYFHERTFEYYHSVADLARIHGADKMRAFSHAFVQTNDLLDFEESGDAVDASSCFCAIRRIGLGPAQFANATCGTKAAMASACPWQPEWAPGSRLDLSPGTIQRVRKLRRRQINPRLRPLRQSLSPKIPPPLGSGCRLRNEG